jgi:hypothetical protein
MLALGPIYILNVGSVACLEILSALVQMLAIRILDRLDQHCVLEFDCMQLGPILGLKIGQ